MPPLEWDKIMAAQPDSLSEEDVDNFYESLSTVSVKSSPKLSTVMCLYIWTPKTINFPFVPNVK